MVDMDIESYFKEMEKGASLAYEAAGRARARGYDPETYVEIVPAPDLPSRVEGIIGVDGIGRLIREKTGGMTRYEAAFAMVREVCTSESFSMETQARLTLATRVGLWILTEGILVAPTEGVQGVELHRNADGSDYVSVVYAGPIRGAGGTSAALSVALADFGRKLLGIGIYRAQRNEVERALEEIQLYHARIARLQYLPPESDIRVILENCPVSIDGLPTEDLELSIHRNVKRLDAGGKEQAITNRVRGGVGLVVCEGIAQKAKSVIKHAKNAGLDWSWLNEIIRVDKAVSYANVRNEKKDAAFLQELVGGRPIISYPDYPGGFRLRYGRSRLTGIAAKGFSPATMIVLDDFISVGTQVKVEKPGKGSIAMPVDTIEGPFVKLKSGEAVRVNTAEHALSVRGEVAKILSVGDILVTIGDFRKTNTQLIPSSYVEEFWYEQLRKNGYKENLRDVTSFEQAFKLSMEYRVPMHPRYLYEYQDISLGELREIARAVAGSKIKGKGGSVFDIEELVIGEADAHLVRDSIERLCIPHVDRKTITIAGGDAQSLVSSLGLVEGDRIKLDGKVADMYEGDDAVAALGKVSQFAIMRRSYRIGGRVGRPEKARERLMKSAPHGMFPVGEYGGRERSIVKAYFSDKNRFGAPKMELEVPRYRCGVGGEPVLGAYCTEHSSRAHIERICSGCGRKAASPVCGECGGRTSGSEVRNIDMAKAVDGALARLGIGTLPKAVKGVKGIMNKDRVAEPVEKGILRSVMGVHVFKDGTCRFDATDAPMTHFYPKEISTGVERLRLLGYDKDAYGNELVDEGQLVELMHQDVIMNRKGAECLFKVAKFVDALLTRYYGLGPFYNVGSPEELVGHYVVTLSPHTSAGVLGRIIGFTDANVGLAHPYTIQARRRNCDGDEDTTMLLLDALINFSKSYLPNMIGGTMDAPLILTERVLPEEIDDEVWNMEVSDRIGLDFYEKTLERKPPSESSVESVGDRRGSEDIYRNLGFTHASTANALPDSPKRSIYTRLKTMDEKIEAQFLLMDRLCTIDKRDTARRLISSHFIPDLMGNLHSFSKQGFRCVSCNAKFRRVPIVGICTRCGGKIVLTISKGSIEKYLSMAMGLADRYDLEPYMKQRLYLIKDEIENVFGGVGGEVPAKQFNLLKFM